MSHSCINVATQVAARNLLLIVLRTQSPFLGSQIPPGINPRKGADLWAIKEKRVMSLIGLIPEDIGDPQNGLCVLRTINKRFHAATCVVTCAVDAAGSPPLADNSFIMQRFLKE
jgi:hypothetical protein